MTSLARMFSGMGGDDGKPPRPKLAPDIEAIRLRDAFEALNVRHEFRPGMIVRQKPQAELYSRYGDNGLAVVIELLAEPVLGMTDPKYFGSAYFRTRLDMLVGSIESIDGGGDSLAIFHVDSRRFEPVPDAELALVTGPATASQRPDRAGPPTPRGAA